MLKHGAVARLLDIPEVPLHLIVHRPLRPETGITQLAGEFADQGPRIERRWVIEVLRKAQRDLESVKELPRALELHRWLGDNVNARGLKVRRPGCSMKDKRWNV